MADDSERFGDEATTNDRSEEGANDFKGMLEEMSRRETMVETFLYTMHKCGPPLEIVRYLV